MTSSSNTWPEQTKLTDAGSVDEICRALELIQEPGQVTELRALGVSTPDYRRPHIVSGYFDDIEALAREASELTRYASGVYFIPNVVNPALLARAANRTRPVNDERLTSDRDIVARRWLLIDIDAKRPSGISSSDKEHEAAIGKARQIRTELTKRGWPLPILADSGNGAHLMYRMDLPVEDAGLVKGVLEGLAMMFDDEQSQVDTAVFNPARIWKLPGTFGRKGDDLPNRPHRMAHILETPEGD